MAERKGERRATLEELVEATAMRAIQSHTGSASLPIDVKLWGTRMNHSTYEFWEQNVKPNLPEKTSRYPHRQLATAVEAILGKHSSYSDRIVVEMKEFYGPDPNRIKEKCSSLRGIVLHKKSKSHPEHFVTEVRD